MLANFIHSARSFYSVLAAKQLYYVQNFKRKLSQYSRPQKLYALSLLLIILFPSSSGISIAIAFAALIMECLPIVHYCWRSLIGKAIILLIYAVIANFALANAASVVNQVTGVSSSFFSYSHNFAILLYIPTWIAAITILGLVFFQVISIIYVSIILLLKPFGIASKLNISKYPHPVITMIIRISLMIVIVNFLQDLSENALTNNVQVMSAEGDSKDKPDAIKSQNTEVSIDTNKAVSSLPVIADNQDLLEASIDSMEFDLNRYISEISDEDATPSTQFLKSTIDVLTKKNKTDNQIIEKLVAQFIYYFDSDPQTRCELKEGSHGVVLNDYEVLQITPDEKQQLGYKYQVKTCISPAFPEAYYQH